MSNSQIMAKLKEATRSQHEAIEGSLGAIMGDDLSLEDYGQYLLMNQGFYQAFEPKVSALLPAPGYVYAYSPKLPLIEKDLAFLQVDRVETSQSDVSLPLLQTIPQLIGALYVIEGSTLGSQIISKHVRTTLRLYAGGCDFLTGYGKDTAARWKAFGQAAEAYVIDDMEAMVIESARSMFQCMHNWFSECSKAA